MELRGFVQQDTVGVGAENTYMGMKASKRGEMVVMDFYQQMAMEGRIYQVRAGTVTTPIVGDVVITDASAEMCADATTGTAMIPVQLDVSIRLGTGTLHEYAAKSAGAVSTAGTAFVPLNLRIGGVAPRTTARASTAGGVTVAAELATTTRRHWSYSNPVAVGAGHNMPDLQWAPANPPVLVGPSCFYVQIAATGTGPSYYASFDYIEFPTTAVS